MQKIEITARLEVPDDVAGELVASIKDDETRRSVGGKELLLRFLRDNPPDSVGYTVGGVKPPAA